MLNKTYLIFAFFLLFIGGVSSFDVFLTVDLQDQLRATELNPVARAILSYDNWDVARFVGLKMFGTILVLGISICLFCKNKSLGLFVSGTLTIFQACLLLFLVLC